MADYDRRIGLDKRSPETIDGFGEAIPTWAAIGTRWAMVSPVKDGERFANAEATATITHRFLIRWDQALWRVIDPTCRVRFDGFVYDIVAIKEVGRRDGIEISATARAERAR